ncbi:hypothetical protein WBG78_02970 [Chryseolinea sp. T2]|uniref:hypothetical protein n=1 Tax=Chryseolinea sp. T2 TaxID=3129255 RepID=UPI003077A411
MRTLIHLAILLTQGALAFITLMIIYMIFVLMDYQGGIDGLIGTTVIQPIIGGLITVVTIGICVFIGLPIRLSERINAWWSKRIWLALSGLLLGLVLLVVSTLPFMTTTVDVNIDGDIVPHQIPNLAAAASGWFLTSFCVLHTFPPYNVRRWAEGMIGKYIP